MHFIFIPYGKRDQVELLLREMEAQKHQLRLKKEGKKDKFIWLQGQIRMLPLGIYEYIFPREDLDLVLHTLLSKIDYKNDRYLLGKRLTLLRALLK